MSSKSYSAYLTPNRSLRRFVVLGAIVLLLVGVIFAVALPFSWQWRSVLSAAWIAFAFNELRLLCAAQHRFCGVRVFAGGSAEILDCDGHWQSAECLAGSVLVHRVAWLRLQSVDGRIYQELIRGDRRQSREWRRFHIIWRFIGVAS